MLAAMVEFQMVGFAIDAAYTMDWKLALLSFPLQYLYLGRHSQFHISLLQMMHLLGEIMLWSPIPSKINQHLIEYSITGYPEHTE